MVFRGKEATPGKRYQNLSYAGDAKLLDVIQLLRKHSLFKGYGAGGDACQCKGYGAGADIEWIYRIIGKAVYEAENAKELVKSLQMENRKLRQQLEAPSGFGVKRSGVYSQYKECEKIFGRTLKREVMQDSRSVKDSNLKPCKFCNIRHWWGSERCPAFGKYCKICKMKNHSADACRNKRYKKIAKIESLPNVLVNEVREISKEIVNGADFKEDEGKTIEARIAARCEAEMLDGSLGINQTEEETSNSKENSCGRDGMMTIEDEGSLDKVASWNVAKGQSKEDNKGAVFTGKINVDNEDAAKDNDGKYDRDVNKIEGAAKLMVDGKSEAPTVGEITSEEFDIRYPGKRKWIYGLIVRLQKIKEDGVDSTYAQGVNDAVFKSEISSMKRDEAKFLKRWIKDVEDGAVVKGKNEYRAYKDEDENGWTYVRNRKHFHKPPFSQEREM